VTERCAASPSLRHPRGHPFAQIGERIGADAELDKVQGHMSPLTTVEDIRIDLNGTLSSVAATMTTFPQGDRRYANLRLDSRHFGPGRPAQVSHDL
jgi:hypothetical protein